MQPAVLLSELLQGMLELALLSAQLQVRFVADVNRKKRRKGHNKKRHNRRPRHNSNLRHKRMHNTKHN